MNDIINHKQVTGQMNHQTADPLAETNVPFFANAIPIQLTA
jgi:hypothetical protein